MYYMKELELLSDVGDLLLRTFQSLPETFGQLRIFRDFGFELNGPDVLTRDLSSKIMFLRLFYKYNAIIYSFLISKMPSN